MNLPVFSVRDERRGLHDHREVWIRLLENEVFDGGRRNIFDDERVRVVRVRSGYFRSEMSGSGSGTGFVTVRRRPNASYS